MSAVEFVFVLLFVFAALGIIGYNFFKLSKSQQEAKVKEWLLFAVIEAEKHLGEGTGKIKLRFVYDMFVSKFKYLSVIISFEQFSFLVDEALEEMKNIAKNNTSVCNYIKGSEK